MVTLQDESDSLALQRRCCPAETLRYLLSACPSVSSITLQSSGCASLAKGKPPFLPLFYSGGPAPLTGA